MLWYDIWHMIYDTWYMIYCGGNIFGDMLYLDGYAFQKWPAFPNSFLDKFIFGGGKIFKRCSIDVNVKIVMAIRSFRIRTCFSKVTRLLIFDLDKFKFGRHPKKNPVIQKKKLPNIKTPQYFQRPWAVCSKGQAFYDVEVHSAISQAAYERRRGKYLGFCNGANGGSAYFSTKLLF